MSAEIQLSNPATIKAYFEKVCELRKSGKKYPVDMELVWPLVYSAKEKAVRALRKSFFENEDFEVLALNGENPLGGRPEKSYRLTVDCVEHFVARKNRAVFDVYKEVFHQTVDAIEQAQVLTPLHVSPVALAPTRKELALMVVQAEEENERLALQLAIAKPKVEYVDQVLDTHECLVTTQIANELGYSAIKFNQWLHSVGIQWKVNGVWVLTAKYADRGYTQMRTHIKTLDNGETHSYMNMVWTQRGRAFLHYEFKKQANTQQLATV